MRQTAPHVPAHRDGKPWLSIAALVVIIAKRIVDPSTMERLRLDYFDFQQSAWPRSLEGQRVVIVDVDETSLTWVGQWPWPRSTVARLTSEIAEMRPAMIGFDVLFPEPDRLSPQQIIRSLPSIDPESRSHLMSLPSNDTLLADSFRRVPVVLAMVALPATAAVGNSSGTTPVSLVAEAGADARGRLMRFTSLITNIAELDAAASGRGAVTLVPDEDGVLRRSAAAVVVRDRLFPSLAVEMARVAAQAEGITLVGGNLGIEAVRIADDRLPTDRAAICGSTTPVRTLCRSCRQPTSSPAGFRRPAFVTSSFSSARPRSGSPTIMRRPSAIAAPASRFMPSCSRTSWMAMS